MHNDFEAEPNDALISALTEFRATVDHLINEQIARLNEWPDEAVPFPAAVSSAGTGAERTSAAVLPVSAPPAPISRATIRAAAAERRIQPATVVKRSASKNGAHDPANGAHDPAKPNGAERDDHDPRQRLDALARHLDNRLRRARDVGTDRTKPPTEP